MIVRLLTRRALVAGGLLATAALTGCSASDLTTRKIEDPEATDRARIQQARDLALRLRADIEAAVDRDPKLAVPFAMISALHTAQIDAFTRSAGLNSSSKTPATSGPTTPLTLKVLPDREYALAQSFRALALQSLRGEVAALLASAAAGIDQALVR